MKKTLCIVLITAMLLSIMPMVVFAETPAGTAISTVDELKAIGATGEYYLANDITISGNWDLATVFNGTLNGNGHTIYFADGVTIAGGLFRELQGDCTIKNLNIVQLGTATYNATTSSQLSGATIEGIGALAALAYGDFKTTTITNVSVYANITASGRNVGGLIGEVRYNNLDMSYCVFNGSITTTGGEDNYGTAGMVGGTWQRAATFNIQYCVNYGTITAESFAGGIFGTNRVGDDKSDNGLRNTRIMYCLNYGDVTSTKSEYAGGIFARYMMNDQAFEVRFKNNINYGAIKNTNTTEKKQQIAAGIGGGYRGSSNANNNSQLMGNINYGTLTASWVSNMVANPWTGSIKSRDKNFCGTEYSGGYGSALITDAEAVVTELNNAFGSQIYTTLPNGKITLIWAYTDATLVGVQLSEIVGEEGSETRSVRFVGGIGEEFGDLDNLGIIIVAIDSNGKRIKMFEGKTDTVYKTLKAGGEDVYAEDYGKTYFYTAVVNNIPVSLGELTFELIPFEIADGVVTYGYQGSVTVDLAKVETPAA